MALLHLPECLNVLGCLLHIEPDEWCHLLLPAGMDPNKVDVKVGSCGLEELKERLWKLVEEAKTADNESEQESGRHGF